MNRWLGLAAATALAAFSMSVHGTDVWDAEAADDDTAALTQNVLWHTAPAQVHDLQGVGGVPDVDWYVISPRERRSYEVQVLNVTPQTGLGFIESLQRYDDDLVTLLQQSTSLGVVFLRTLRWIEPSPAQSARIRVLSGASVATTNSDYSIQLRETTLYCPRYNNTGSQISVLIIQQTTPEGTSGGLCGFEARFNNASGGETGMISGALFTNAVHVTSTPAIPGVAGTSGSAFIAHSCGWGGMKAKLVALEPATGFSFDTPCTAREH